MCDHVQVGMGLRVDGDPSQMVGGGGLMGNGLPLDPLQTGPLAIRLGHLARANGRALK
jgi:hypothetical protein